MDLKISEDKLIEILEFPLPSTWRMHVTLARFDPQDQTVKETLDYCEEIKVIKAEFISLAPMGVNNKHPVRGHEDGGR